MNRMKLHGKAAAFTESLSSTFAVAATLDYFLNRLLSSERDNPFGSGHTKTHMHGLVLL